MTPYNQIIQLHNEGLNNTEIANSFGTVSRKTVITVLQLIVQYGLEHPEPNMNTDTEIHRLLHPKKANANRMPDLERIAFESRIPGVSIAKMWRKYCAECASDGVNYDTSRNKFQNYYKDVSLRMKNKELDLLIVVNMFLTGFDATTQKN